MSKGPAKASASTAGLITWSFSAGAPASSALPWVKVELANTARARANTCGISRFFTG